MGKALIRIVPKQLLFSSLNSGKSLSSPISQSEEMAGFLLKRGSNLMKVSVVIPCYNEKDTIHRPAVSSSVNDISLRTAVKLF